jgi:ABC-type antimicrobial peptide transport system permease subunit
VAGYLTAGGSLERASSRLQQLFWDGTTVTSASGRQLAHTLGRAALSPVRTVAGMVALFAAAGVFALLLLSFLKHKRYFGILKALGMESSEVGLLLVLEGLLVAVSGTGCGWIIALVLVRVVNRHTALPLVLRAELFAASLVLAAGAFLVASWVPVALTRRATVDQLLHNRRVYLDPNPSCAQCGRCGGF